MAKYAKHVSKKKTDQKDQMREDQVLNSAGGYVWEVDCWKKLDRFLILGNEGGSYYSSEKKMTKENAQAVLECLNKDGKRAVGRIVELSESGRICKNDSAIFALALASSVEDKETRSFALSNLSKVCRIGTHLFTFLEMVKELRGRGRGLRNALAKWYLEKDSNKLAYQVSKYRNRNNWKHLDVLRLSHPKTKDTKTISVFKWIKDGSLDENTPDLLRDFNDLQNATTSKEVIKLVKKNKSITWEMIKTELMTKEVWQVLIHNMPLNALIRNLARMTANESIAPLSNETEIVCNKLKDAEYIKESMLHPISILGALNVYNRGHGIKGSLTWNPIPQIKVALEKAFYLAFDNVESTNKNYLLAIDCSSSMRNGNVSGVEGLSPHVAATAMAMVTAKKEENNFILGFTRELVDLGITSEDSLVSAMKKTQLSDFGSTNCSLPMVYATDNKLNVDVFIVYTDNETWASHIHPKQALDEYRRKVNANAKLIVVSMLANNFSIADPNDSGMLDVVGFDTNVPDIINQFSKGDL